ncbi:MAG: chemotaxis protein, partial [Alphaproteobacteria bacterium]|nr:chemotaxis protein [Alphaproteobacteria bacterium]
MARRSRAHRGIDIWPGFVDALSTLLLGITFLLVVFTFGQNFLSQALSGRDEALQRLDRQLAELTDFLSLERQANADLRLSMAQLSASLQESSRERATLALRAAELDGRLAAATTHADQAEVDLATLQKSMQADREKIELQLAELVSLRRDVDALRAVRADLEKKVAEHVAEATATRDRSKELEARLVR